jgi:FAD/FMN-containing dehydrogenase
VTEARHPLSIFLPLEIVFRRKGVSSMTSDTKPDLTARIRGPVLDPGAPGYDEARKVFNGMIDRRPNMIVEAVDTADVMATVTLAREQGLSLAVRSGGHSVPGYGVCEDGVVLDLSAIRNVRIDPETRRARVGGGALLGGFDHAAGAFGLATPAGFFSTTGVGGLTLGGGIGPHLSRRYGLTCDNLLSADVVTAEGERVTASEDRNPDLFWALRGGGGNFGVVTSFEFRLHPVDTVIAGPIVFEPEAAADALRVWGDMIRAGPRELGGFAAMDLAPELPFIPAERQGTPVCLLLPCWSGAPEEAEGILDTLRGAGPVIGEHVDAMPYPDLQSAFDPLLPPGLPQYWKANYVSELTHETVDACVRLGLRVPTEWSTMHLYAMNGAVQDVGTDATAFGFRNAEFAAVIVGAWKDPARGEHTVEWVKDYHVAIHSHSGYEGGYTNFAAPDDQVRVRENYGPAFDRLRRVKSHWDPDNLFALNQNIEPAS